MCLVGARLDRAPWPRYFTLGSPLGASFSSLFVLFPPSRGLKRQGSTQAVMAPIKATRITVEAPVLCTLALAFLFFSFFFFFCFFAAPSSPSPPALLGVLRGRLSKAALCSQKKKMASLFFVLFSAQEGWPWPWAFGTHGASKRPHKGPVRPLFFPSHREFHP